MFGLPLAVVVPLLVLAYSVVEIAVALAVGRMLRHTSRHYPRP